MQPIQDILKNERRIFQKSFSNFSSKTAIFIAALHGNEQSGITALNEVFEELQEQNIQLNGNIIALKGNIKAIEQNKRYIHEDLNRAWSSNYLYKLSKNLQKTSEAEEVKELKEILDLFIERTKAPLLMVDLHTTSSESVPFCIMNDTIRNRNQVKNIPIPKVLGIIEKLEGTLIGHYSNKGPITTVFEAGEHFNPESITRHKAIIYLSLVQFGIINQEDIDFNKHFNLLQNANKYVPKLLNTTVRYSLEDNDEFKMEEGFENFSRIKKNQLLATHNQRAVKAEKNSYLFMPLYQSQGNDGFFIVQPIPSLVLTITTLIRIFKLDHYISLFTGIYKHNKNDNTFIINKKIASKRSIQFLKLLGYRKVKQIEDTLFISKLPYDLKGPWD